MTVVKFLLSLLVCKLSQSPAILTTDLEGSPHPSRGLPEYCSEMARKKFVPQYLYLII
jgi:hypothetical protein